MYLYLSIYLSTCIYIYLSICVRLSVSIRPSFHLSVRPPTYYLPTYIPTYPYICPSVYLSVCPSAPSVRPPLHPPALQSIRSSFLCLCLSLALPLHLYVSVRSPTSINRYVSIKNTIAVFMFLSSCSLTTCSLPHTASAPSNIFSGYTTGRFCLLVPVKSRVAVPRLGLRYSSLLLLTARSKERSKSASPGLSSPSSFRTWCPL